jgi:hypothetical protein
MIRRILVVGCLLALSVSAALAGGKTKSAMTGAADKMAMASQEMTQEMMKCDVCKHMAPHMSELGPVMTMDMATLNDGVAFLHGVSDPAKVEKFRMVSAEMEEAGEACMDYTDAQAKSQLCEMCQGIRKAVQSGAKMSMGPTKMGDIMVLTSDDPAVQKQLAELGTMCEMMMTSMPSM